MKRKKFNLFSIRFNHFHIRIPNVKVDYVICYDIIDVRLWSIAYRTQINYNKRVRSLSFSHIHYEWYRLIEAVITFNYKGFSSFISFFSSPPWHICLLFFVCFCLDCKPFFFFRFENANFNKNHSSVMEKKNSR